jgi:phosphatidylglycerophosphatase C
VVLALHHANNNAHSGIHLQANETVMTARVAKPVVAAFDFDGTLTRRETLLPFLRFMFGDAGVIRYALTLAPTLAGYGLALLDNAVAKERVFVKCFAGMPMEELRHQGERFAAYVLPGLLSDKSMQRFVWHKQQGHRCVVISASLDVYVRPWALGAGFDLAIATRLETGQNGRTTGRIMGQNCFGMEKVNRLRALLGEKDDYILYAYGDSRGDKELLSYADHAYFREIPA